MATCMGNAFLDRNTYAGKLNLFTLPIVKALNKTRWKIGTAGS